MSLLRCINCDIRVTRIKRHLLANESEALRNVFRVWTYPREATNSDFICQACWELGNAQVTGANSLVNEGKPVGHHNICIGCGRSILKLSSRIILRENRTIDEGPIIDIISSWIHPRQLAPTDQACMACWLRAQRTLRRQQVIDEVRANQELSTCVNCNIQLSPGQGYIVTNEDQNVINMIKNWIYPNHVNPMDFICHACRQLAIDATQQDTEPTNTTSQPEVLSYDDTQDANHNNPSLNPLQQDHITLLSIRRAAATPRHCVFPNCGNVERYHVPDQVRSRVVKQFNYYIPRDARICSYHAGANMFHDLYLSSVQQSVETFVKTDHSCTVGTKGNVQQFCKISQINQLMIETTDLVRQQLLQHWISIQFKFKNHRTNLMQPIAVRGQWKRAKNVITKPVRDVDSDCLASRNITSRNLLSTLKPR
ncbi:hypothetical protein ACJJTC_014480 [Scirpophaga incertulas]